MTRRALITGGAGFVGQWLARALLRQGWRVTSAGIGARPDAGSMPAEERDAVEWLLVDVRHQDDITRALDASRPDAIFHLAGISFVPDAQGDPALAYEVNVIGAARLLADIRRRRRAGTLDPAVLVVGSAEQYGRHEPDELPLPETAEQRPLTVYAASKAAQEVVALEAARSDGVRVVATRSFNHSGPRQPAQFLLPALVRRALALRASGDSALRIGNTDTVRDFLHVADVADAYVALAERGVAGVVYNVCSGQGYTVAELAARVLDLAGVDARLEQDPALVRPVEVPALVGDPARIRAAAGWSPTRSTDDIILDLIHAATR